MALPTRFIDTEEFRRVAGHTPNVEDTVPRYVLGAFSFVPPRPDEEYRTKPNELVNVMLLNVAEPVLYRDPSNNMAFVILPWAMDDEFDYDYMHGIHPNKKAWGYFLAPAGYRLDDTEEYLNGDWVWYREDDIPAFELGKVETH